MNNGDGWQVRIVESLCRHGANLGMVDLQHRTALHHAARHKHVKACKVSNQ